MASHDNGERDNEELVRRALRVHGIHNGAAGHIYAEQSFPNVTVEKLLKTASKSQGGGKGTPEFIVLPKPNKDNLVLVVECKAHNADHASDDGKTNAARFAVDGVLHYARFLSAKYNVIAVASSGINAKTWRVSTYLHRKGAAEPEPLKTPVGADITTIVSWDEYRAAATFDPADRHITETELLTLSKNVHNFIRHKLPEASKALFVAGTLIALKSDRYRRDILALKPNTGDQNPRAEWERGVNDALAAKYGADSKGEPVGKGAVIREQLYSVIGTNPSLYAPLSSTGSVNGLHIRLATTVETVARVLADKVYEELQNNTAFDILGAFYGEFLSYSGGDQKNGIVLTPRHITELMCDLAKVEDEKSVVLDTCTGTGGFLIAAMNKMCENTPKATHEYIKKNCLVGIEKQSDMYALASANMLLRGDGKSSLYNFDCFLEEAHEAVANRKNEDNTSKPKPNVGIINPPYGGVDGKSELKFITNMLDMLTKNGIGVAVVPVSTATRMGNDRKELMSRHTLRAVMTMPRGLFKEVDVQPVIMVFKAHVPHDDTKKSWFAKWEDDGHAVVLKQGRKDIGRWETIKKDWLTEYRRATLVDDKPGEFFSRAVGVKDPWTYDAHVPTDYSALMTAEPFEKVVMNYADYLRDNAMESDLVATWDKEEAAR